MNENEIGGIIVTALVGIVGLLKFELIREVVKKITSEGKVKAFSITFLIVISLIPFVVGHYMPVNKLEEPLTEPIAKNNDEGIKPETVLMETPSQKKTDVEVGIEATTFVIKETDKLVRQAKENKRKRDSTFLANREQRWVYQIGDWMDSDAVFALYKKLGSKKNVRLFREKKRYFLFIDDHRSRDEMVFMLDSLREQFSQDANVKMKVTDLMSYCATAKQEIVMEFKTLGKKGDKTELECYRVD